MVKEITTKEAETNMDNGVSQEVVVYVRDYFAKYYGDDMKTIHDNISKLVNHVEGSEAIVAAVPSVYPPSDKAPVGTLENPIKAGSFYFNITTKMFMSYKDGAWVLMADLKDLVDLSDYMKIEELYKNFVPGYYGKLEDLYKVENGELVVDKNVMVLNIAEIAELVKDQREIDRNFLANFKDELTYVSSNKISYKDTTLDMETLSAQVQTNGNAVTYTTLIKPYDRINQEQANFEAIFEVGASVQYMFNSKFKAVKFTGTAGQTYKWETFGKFEQGKRVPYIRFSGTATMETSSNPLDLTSWTTHPLPYEVKLSDWMDETNRTAIVTFTFGGLPTFGTHFMTIEYLTSTYYVESRFAGLIRNLKLGLDELQGGKSVYEYPTVGGSQMLIIQYPDGDKPAQMKVGDEILVSIDKSKVPAGLYDTTPMCMQNLADVSADAAANQASFQLIQSQANANQAEDDLFKYVRRWSYIKDMIENYYLILTKSEDFDGKTIWVPTGWQKKPAPAVEEAKNYFKDFTKASGDIALNEEVKEGLYDIEIEWIHPNTNKAVTFFTSTVQAIAGDRVIISKSVKLPGNIASMIVGASDGPDGPVYYGSYNVTLEFGAGAGANTISKFILKDIEFFDPYAATVATVNLGGDQRVIMTGGNAVIANMLKDTFIIKKISKAGTFVKNTDNAVDPAIGWVNVGPGHGKQVLGFTDSGKPKFQHYFNKDEANLIYQPKTYDYSETQSTVNLNITGGKRYLIITQHADAPTTPIGATNKIWIAHPGGAQDADQVTYGTDLIWIVKKDGNIMTWDEIKNNVLHDDKMIIKHLSNGNWEFQSWEIAVEPVDLTEVYNAIDAEEVARVTADNEIWNKLNALDGGRFVDVKLTDNTFPLATDTATLTNLWTAQQGSAPQNKDHMEVQTNDLSKFALYTFDGTSWSKGADRDTHIKGGVQTLKPAFDAIEAEELARIKADDELWAELDLDDADLIAAEAVALPTATRRK